MAFDTENLGLRVWDLGTDDFSYSELANNWSAIDLHDHGPGNGLQIPEAGIANNAVTQNKIANNAVATAKLQDDAVTGAKVADGAIATNHIGVGAVQTTNIFDGAVTSAKIGDGQVVTAKIADGAITSTKVGAGAIGTTALATSAVTTDKVGTDAITNDKIANDAVDEDQLAAEAVTTEKVADESITSGKLDPNVLPVGTVIPWFRPSDSTAIPSGWVVPIGQSLTDANHDFAENATITLPDMRNKFLLGAYTSGTGTGNTTPPAIGTVGGPTNHARDIGVANIANHVHTIAADTHTHGIQARHPTWPDWPSFGEHQLAYMAIPIPDWRWAGNGEWQRSYGKIHRVNVLGFHLSDDIGIDLPPDQYIGQAGPLTSGPIRYEDAKPVISKFGAPLASKTHSHGALTGDGIALGSESSSTDLRPSYVGVLYLMKVKH